MVGGVVKDMFGRSWKRLCLASLIMLMCGLGGCGVLSQTPPDAAVELALTKQLMQTQESLQQFLGLEGDRTTPNFKIDSIDVQSRTKVRDVAQSLQVQQAVIDEAGIDEVYKVKGTFRAKLKASGYDDAQPSSPFEVYLGTNTAEESEVETWYLVPSPEA